jgi:hypothetical protein
MPSADKYLPELKLPLPGYEELRQLLWRQLGPNRSPLLIAIDGADCLGKTSLASWLAWQLGMPAVHLDLYMIDFGQWREDDLTRVIDARRGTGRPSIVEGVLALDALARVGQRPDFLVYVRGDGPGTRRLADKLVEYAVRRKPEQSADFVLDGYVEPESPKLIR